MTATISRSPTCSNTASASSPGSMTMTSSSSPMSQPLHSAPIAETSCSVISADHIRSTRASTTAPPHRAPDQAPTHNALATLLRGLPRLSGLGGEGEGGFGHQLDRDRGQQQAGDPGQQLDAVVGKHPVDDLG